MSIHDIADEELRSGITGCTILCQMDFKTNPRNWWLGYGSLTAGGVEYQGMGDVIQISAIEVTYGMSAGMVRFTIPNASPEMIGLCDNQGVEVNGRRVQVLYQLFSTVERDGQHRHRFIDDPISIFFGRMRDMTTTSSADNRTIELECYGKLSQQVRPPHGRWTGADQKSRSPGDKGLDLLVTLKDKAVPWAPGS